MADDGLIAAYLRELRFSLGRLADADDFVDEAEDHLRECAEVLAAAGHPAAEAEAEAVARFGSAELVARISAIEAKRGVAVPTTRTRQAGLAAMFTPVLFVVGQYLNLTVPAKEGNAHGIGLGLLAAGFAAFVFGLWGLRARHGGLGRAGKVAIIAAVISPFFAFGAWVGLFVAMALLGFAIVVLVVEMLRANVLPVVPLVLVASGPLGMLALVIGISVTGRDAGGVWFTPGILMVTGYVWLGWHLWQERAYDGPSRLGEPFATA